MNLPTEVLKIKIPTAEEIKVMDKAQLNNVINTLEDWFRPVLHSTEISKEFKTKFREFLGGLCGYYANKFITV